MADEISEVASSIAEEVIEISHEDLLQNLQNEVLNSSNLLPIIRQKIYNFIDKVEQYENSTNYPPATLGAQLNLLETKKEFIYAEFFEIQNLINLFINQKIIMTYVHVDDEGRREIRISEKDISHLGISQSAAWNGNPFYKLSYDVNDHYQLLKNSLPQEKNESLQQTAIEIDRRYATYRKRILWYYPDFWKGYYLKSHGPINEAYVNLYVHNVQLLNSLEGNIDTFMLDQGYGAINADATRGYLIGDVSKDGIQYAVKGKYGSPQGVKEIIKSFRQLISEDFTEESFKSFLKQYTEDELNKEYKPQIKQMTERSINSLYRYHKKAFDKIKITANIKI